MRASTIVYTLKQGLKNIYRNKMFSLASMATMAACIFMFSLFFAIVSNLDNMVREAESGVGVTVFFNSDMTTEQIQALGAQISERPEVDHLVYVSAEEAWEQYKKEYLKGAEELAEGARALEAAAREGRTDYIMEHHGEVMNSYRNLLNLLRRELQS